MFLPDPMDSALRLQRINRLVDMFYYPPYIVALSPIALIMLTVPLEMFY